VLDCVTHALLSAKSFSKTCRGEVRGLWRCVVVRWVPSGAVRLVVVKIVLPMPSFELPLFEEHCAAHSPVLANLQSC
jgi:hypothetical protein